MDSMLIPILVAATVALFAWGAVSVVTAALDPERKRLKNRLNADAKRPGAAGSAGQKAIVYNTEAVGFSAILTKWSPLDTLHKRLLHAWPELSVAKFLMIALGCGVLSAMTFGVVTFSIPIACGAALIGASIPFIVLTAKRAQRQKTLANQLPEALDFLCRVLKAGHSFSTGVQMMGEELPKPLSLEFRRAYDQHTLGQSIESALKDMAARIDSTDFAFLVTAVMIQRQTGGDLSEVLENIGGMIRGRVRLEQHVKAKTAEGRLTGYVLVAFPMVMFFLLAFLNPKYARSLTSTDTGHKLLITAFGLQMMGLWAIKRITTIKV